MYGNKDTEKKFDLSKLKGNWQDQFVVHHFDYMSKRNGEQIVDDSTSRIQVYDKKTYEELSSQRTRVDAKRGEIQLPSRFQELNLNVEILHDPTLNSESKSKDMKAPEAIAKINELETADEIDSFVEGETKKGVLEAAAKRKEQLG